MDTKLASDVQKIFDETPTFILQGESNVGKTTLLNLLLSKVLNENVTLFSNNNINSTKITTIVKLTKNKEDNFRIQIYKKNKMKEPDIDRIFDSCDELIAFYNNSSMNKDLYFDDYCQIHFYSNEMIRHELLLIDVIGRTYNINYEKYINKICTDHPNHVKLHVIKDLNFSSFNNTEFNILTHIDKIDYIYDPTMLEKHKHFVNFINNSLFMVTNTTNKLFINIDNVEYNAFNESNIMNMFNIIYDKSCFVNNNHKLDNFIDDFTLSCDLLKSRNDIMKYNNKILLNKYDSLINHYKLLELIDILNTSKISHDIIIEKMTNRNKGEGVVYFIEQYKHLFDNTIFKSVIHSKINEYVNGISFRNFACKISNITDKITQYINELLDSAIVNCDNELKMSVISKKRQRC